MHTTNQSNKNNPTQSSLNVSSTTTSFMKVMLQRVYKNMCNNYNPHWHIFDGGIRQHKYKS